MSKIHVIDGKKYVEVDRKAEVGEKIIVTKKWYSNDIGKILEVINGKEFNISDATYQVYYNHPDNCDRCLKRIENEYYRVLEPIEEETQPSPDLTNLLANLARRVLSLEQQLTDTQRNVEQLAQELATIKHDIDDKVEMVIDDIVLLDERTQTEGHSPTQEADVVTFDKFLDSVADRVAERLVGR
jgi:chromosome segregation ATPase